MLCLALLFSSLATSSGVSGCHRSMQLLSRNFSMNPARRVVSHTHFSFSFTQLYPSVCLFLYSRSLSLAWILWFFFSLCPLSLPLQTPNDGFPFSLLLLLLFYFYFSDGARRPIATLAGFLSSWPSVFAANGRRSLLTAKAHYQLSGLANTSSDTGINGLASVAVIVAFSSQFFLFKFCFHFVAQFRHHLYTQLQLSFFNFFNF